VNSSRLSQSKTFDRTSHLVFLHWKNCARVSTLLWIAQLPAEWFDLQVTPKFVMAKARSLMTSCRSLFRIETSLKPALHAVRLRRHFCRRKTKAGAFVDHSQPRMSVPIRAGLW
jgi:hypothetical protein